MNSPKFAFVTLVKIVGFVIFGTFLGLIAFGVFLTYYNEWSSRRKHAEEIEQAYRVRLLPAVAFIRRFEAREHRLPTDEEMRLAGWEISSMGDDIQIYRERPIWLDSWGIEGKDFLVETRVPDWNLLYRSWDNQRIEANWP